ncbi:hypothetical protein Q8791_23510 [Nocardiopsis sp. CT-R113]|uniref:Uncharacterized protein n=1 Tax=Nocardiopsis codii TaxID=3065942 RepID=A0ABU7KD81_9ACTN|nr:hypothetical protein [Nocardiopsis sp. CT-R113]MEE2040189.1 hypothetical protein [Nocardiopsis sp. CT-R113]
MRMSFVQPAGEGSRFAEGAFDGVIGKTIPVNTPEGRHQGRVVAATVAEDGQSVELTVEVDGFVLPQPVSGPGLLSVTRR